MASHMDIQALADSFSKRSPWYRALSVSRRTGMVIAALSALIAGVLYLVRSTSEATKYVVAEVTRGAVVRTVTATGTLNPVIAVQVGSYVSGPVIAIYADFNAAVMKGQLIAKIDPQPFELKLEEARAQLSNSKTALTKDKADMHYKKLLYERNHGLLLLGAASQNTVDNDFSIYQQASAQIALDQGMIRQQEAALKEVKVSLNYTNITSPVDGIVVSRNVDVGQTVAASFQTPTLFVIAKDLTQMQVDCTVSESDIGGVHEAQIVTFRVDAFPDHELQGTIAQVRQAPITVQNVVTYDVVVRVVNPELLLKPGMTANVSIVTARRDDVIRIPAQALRFVPRGETSKSASNSSATDPVNPKPNRATIWVRHGTTLKSLEVTTGLNDGNYVEIVSGDLRLGQKVVIDEKRRTKRTQTITSPQLSS
jgi:HlyD family secretion protein